MGLIYRSTCKSFLGFIRYLTTAFHEGLNGMQLPDQLPRELVPSSRQDLGDTVDHVKELLHRETRTLSLSSSDSPVSILKNRSFYEAAPSFKASFANPRFLHYLSDC